MDKIAGYLEVATNGRREVVINFDKDQTGHVIFSPGQARYLAECLLRQAANADGQLLRAPPPQENRERGNWPSSTRIKAFGKYGVYSPYESHDGDVSWTVQKFDSETDDAETMGEFVAEFANQFDAALFAEAASTADDRGSS